MFLYRLIWKGLLLGVIGFVQGGWGFLEGVEGRWWGEAKEGAAPWGGPGRGRRGRSGGGLEGAEVLFAEAGVSDVEGGAGSGVGLGGAEGGFSEVLEGDVEGFAEGFVGGGFGGGLVFDGVEEGVDGVALFFGGEVFEGIWEEAGLAVFFGGGFGLDAEGGFAGFGDLGVLADGLGAAV